MADKPWTEFLQSRAARILKRAVPSPWRGVEEFVVPLRVGEELSLQGVVDLRVARGALEVWGARLAPSSEFVRLSAPAWSALPRLRAERPEEGARELGTVDGDSASLRAFLGERTWPVVLVVRLPEAPPVPLEDRVAGEVDGEVLSHTRLLKVALNPNPQLPRLQAHQVWPSLVENFARLVIGEECSGPATLLLMGAKGVGKSTCCRYFLNALLATGVQEICYLETDLGQPDFSPPGSVSLHRLRRPVLHFAPSVLHEHELVASYFVGSVTPAAHPMLYARCVRSALEAYRGLAPEGGAPPPLVVNSHGWVTGLGLELVQMVLAAAQAQMVVRIRVAASKAADDPEDSSGSAAKRRRSLLARCGPLAQGLRAAAGAGEDDMAAAAASSAVLVDVEPVRAPATGGLQERRAAASASGQVAIEARWLRFACHFRPDLGPCAEPRATAPRELLGPLPRLRLPFGRVRFALIHGGLEAAEAEAVFTGTLVALCRLEGEAPAALGDGAGPRTCDVGHGVPRCIAFAFVHAFDTVRGEVVLILPAGEASRAAALAETTVVVRGDLTWEPHSVKGQLVELGDDVLSPLQPYCSAWMLEGLSAGARLPSNRRDVPRRGLPPRGT